MAYNTELSGDEARMLMGAMMTCSDVSAPIKDTLKLYIKLAQINQAQPIIQPQNEQPTN